MITAFRINKQIFTLLTSIKEFLLSNKVEDTVKVWTDETAGFEMN